MSYIVAESLENPFCCNINYYHDNNKLELIFFSKIILANILYTLKKYELCRHNSMNYAYIFILISCIMKHKGVKIFIYLYIYCFLVVPTLLLLKV